MIDRIGIVIQGPNDRGLIMGIRDRMGCRAVLLPGRYRGNTKFTTRRNAEEVVRQFRANGAQIIVRLTDADGERWQDVKRREKDRFPSEIEPLLVVGVTPSAVEAWLAKHRGYLESALGISTSQPIAGQALISRMKTEIARRAELRDYDEIVRQFVIDAPRDVFRSWLLEPSFEDFYSQCRDAAIREGDCPVNDELRDPSEELGGA